MMHAVRRDVQTRGVGSVSYPEVPQKEEDTQAVASFLLSLKHRSVTPEPLPVDSDQSAAEKRIPYKSYSAAPFESVKSMGSSTSTSSTDLDWEQLLDNSKLVKMKDRDLVPDALFVAMAQMKPCRLTQADRVGCYKSREIGFVGMCCKHCGGQPGFGRYYPNSVRSLAQTTTSQTILKHIGSKCRFCPPDVRDAVLDLQHQQAIREGMSSGRPRYGSRKIFFQRVWSRLHGDGKVEEDDNDSKATDGTDETPSDCDETTTSSSASSTGFEEEVASAKRKNRRGYSLPPNKRFKACNSMD